MQPQTHLPDKILETLVERIIASRKINRNDQKMLMSAFSTKGLLSKEDEVLINRVFDQLKAGLLRIVD